jgi:hypothetical protein
MDTPAPVYTYEFHLTYPAPTPPETQPIASDEV